MTSWRLSGCDTKVFNAVADLEGVLVTNATLERLSPMLYWVTRSKLMERISLRGRSVWLDVVLSLLANFPCLIN